MIDQNRVLIDGPTTGVNRQSFTTKRLHLTSIVLPIHHGSRGRTIRKAWTTADVDSKWAKTSWAQKIQRKKLRENMTDFDRFKVMRARQMRNEILNTTFGKLRKTIKRKPKKVRKGRSKK